METDAIKERIKFYTEIVKIFWAITIVLAGGVATLFINLNSPLKTLLFVIGLFIEFLIMLLIKDYNRQIYCLLAKLEDK